MKKKHTRNRVKKFPIICQFWTKGDMKKILKAIASEEGISLSALMRNISEAAIHQYMIFRIEKGDPFVLKQPPAPSPDSSSEVLL